MSDTRIRYWDVAPASMAKLRELEHYLNTESGLDYVLREMVKLRASQLNGCSYCVDLHTGDAQKAGDTLARIAAVAVWRESSLFTARERAAFTLTESITRASETHVPDADWAAAALVFSPEELGALVSLIVTINAWNLVGVSTHAWV